MVKIIAHKETENIKLYQDYDTAFIMSIYKNDSALNVYLAIQSLLKQTYKKNIIFIYIDGEIHKNVNALLKHISSYYSNVIIYVSAENKGLAFGLNFLIDKILTQYGAIKYIARMDADDISALNRIELQIEQLKNRDDIDIIGAYCKEFGNSFNVIMKSESSDEIKKNIIKYTPLVHPTVIFKRHIFEAGHRYPMDTHQSEDLKFWFQLSIAGYNFYNLPKVLLFYRMTSETLERRVNIHKAISDLKSRVQYLKIVKTNIIKNSIFIIAQFLIKFLPKKILRLLYENFR